MTNDNTPIEELQTENPRLRQQLWLRPARARAAEQKFYRLFTNMTIGSFITDMQHHPRSATLFFKQCLATPQKNCKPLRLLTLTPGAVQIRHAFDQEKTPERTRIACGYTDLQMPAQNTSAKMALFCL